MNTLMCHCFGHTVADIERDVRLHGRSTILERIVAEKTANRCRCAEVNPKGR